MDALEAEGADDVLPVTITGRGRRPEDFRRSDAPAWLHTAEPPVGHLVLRPFLDGHRIVAAQPATEGADLQGFDGARGGRAAPVAEPEDPRTSGSGRSPSGTPRPESAPLQVSDGHGAGCGGWRRDRPRETGRPDRPLSAPAALPCWVGGVSRPTSAGVATGGATVEAPERDTRR